MSLSDADRERELRTLLHAEIEREGSISFRDFMEAALYHPRLGYYATLRGFAAEGDFVTSPETHPVFGALVGRQALDVWEVLGRPRPFRVLELGGGSGALAEALLAWAASDAPEMAEALLYAIEEVSPSLESVQRERLQGRQVEWTAVREPHLVLANEFLDAMSVYRVVVRNGRLRELRVATGLEGSFEWEESESVPKTVEAYFDQLHLLPSEGTVCEVNTSLGVWTRSLAGRIRRGVAIVLDYGYPAEDLFARSAGTLLTYYRHTMGSDPLVRVGRQDISTHVDFTTVASEAAAAGLSVLGMTSQRRMLERLGIGQYWRRLDQPADRQALQSLVDPAGLGKIGALYLARGLDDWAPAGLSGGLEWPEPTWLPSTASWEDAEFLDQWREAFGGDAQDSRAD